MIGEGVAGNAVQSVDAADPLVEFVGSELVDGFGMAIGQLTCAPRGCWEYDTASEPALRVVAAFVESG
jgi:hypothetical protein